MLFIDTSSKYRYHLHKQAEALDSYASYNNIFLIFIQKIIFTQDTFLNKVRGGGKMTRGKGGG